MNTKRSYLDTLNAGRRRRSGTTLEDISQTLSALEQRIAGSRAQQGNGERGERLAPASSGRAERNTAAKTAPPRYTSYANAPASAGQDFDNARVQSEGYAAVHRISEELHALREDLRREFTVGIEKEFDGLRDLLASIYAEAGSSRASDALMPELDRIAEAVETLSTRGSRGDIGQLKSEIEDLKAAIDDLAREESVQSIKTRWSDFDRRWDSIESHLHQSTDDDRHQQRAIAALNARLDSIMEAVGTLPDSLSLRSLDEKIRILGEAIDHVSGGPALPANLLDAVEDRLDEISRAIAATSAPNMVFDTTPIERIEARISSLSKQLGEVLQPSPVFVAQLQELSDRIDAIANRVEMPDESIDRVAKQLAVITDRLEADQPPTDMAVLLQGVEDRILALSDALQRSTDDVAAKSRQMFAELENRLEDLAERFESRPPAGDSAGSSAILADLEERFEKLAERLDADTTRNETNLRMAFDDRFRELESQLAAGRSSGNELQPASVDAIEARLDALTKKLESSTSHGAPYGDVIRNLEAQIANISSFIARSDNRIPDLDILSPRLDEIERALAGNHEQVMEAARLAAADALKSVAGREDGSSKAVAALAEDLKQLDALARRSDERNTKTFEAIHETLLTIVDRLETLEDSGHASSNGSPREKVQKYSVESAPAMETDEDDLLVAGGRHETGTAETSAVDKRSPAEAAADAAFGALKVGSPSRNSESDDQKKRSMLGGLSRALSGKREKPKGRPAASTAARPATDPSFAGESGPVGGDEPLEPGSGAPDLGAIMKRVREEHENPARQMDPDAAKADFIAAARRAAQAAAAEAKVLRGKSDKDKSGGNLSMGTLLDDKRRPLLIAAGAIMIALAGFQLSKSFFNDKPAAVAQKAPVATEPKTTAEITPRTAPENVARVDGGAGKPASEKVRVVDTAKATKSEPAKPSEISAPEPDKGKVEQARIEQTPETDTAMDDAATKLSIDFGPQALREAVARGDAKAYFEVASRYADGRGVPADLAKAATWYTHAAEAGFAPAQYRIGNFYEKGLGVEREVSAAKTWYQMAAEQGNVSAMHNLAVLYAMGAGGTPDNESAVRWFRQAAEFGVKDSQFNLAILAAKGVGTSQDLIESYKWFAVAAQNGDKDAAEKRDEVAKALRPEQLEKARAIADLWKPRPIVTEANAFEAPDAWQGAAEETAAIDMKKAIRNIQLILTKNGYDAGSADGVMGSRTKQAIMEFQKDNGMPVTGEVDEQLVRALLAKK